MIADGGPLFDEDTGEGDVIVHFRISRQGPGGSS